MNKESVTSQRIFDGIDSFPLYAILDFLNAEDKERHQYDIRITITRKSEEEKQKEVDDAYERLSILKKKYNISPSILM